MPLSLEEQERRAYLLNQPEYLLFGAILDQRERLHKFNPPEQPDLFPVVAQRRETSYRQTLAYEGL